MHDIIVGKVRKGASDEVWTSSIHNCINNYCWISFAVEISVKMSGFFFAIQHPCVISAVAETTYDKSFFGQTICSD